MTRWKLTARYWSNPWAMRPNNVSLVQVSSLLTRSTEAVKQQRLLKSNRNRTSARRATIEDADESFAKVGEVVSFGLAVADANIVGRDTEAAQLTGQPGFVDGKKG